MNYKRKGIPCAIVRGGTSKGVFFLKDDLPESISDCKKVLLQVMGSPDKKQINGLGGATSVTSKVAIVSKSERRDADIDYTFCQVSVDKPIVSTQGNCGNISSGVGIFAIEKGLVEIKEPITTVRVFNTNTEKIIVEEIECENRSIRYKGDYSIAGVPGTASPIKLRFLDPVGSFAKQLKSDKLLFPTGNSIDKICIPNYKTIEISIIDAVNLIVFINASEIGLSGNETFLDDGKCALLETVRGIVAVKLRLCDDYTRSAWDSPRSPQIVIVAPPQEYSTVSGNIIKEDDIDLTARMMSMQKLHPTFAMTGALATAIASVLTDSIVGKIISQTDDHYEGKQEKQVRIGHPDGIITANVIYDNKSDGTVQIDEAVGYRTANVILEGIVFVNSLE